MPMRAARSRPRANEAFPKPRRQSSAGSYYGLFYVAPAQNSLHVPAADPERHPQALAVRRRSPTSPSSYGGGYAHVTTRANLQIREIEPKNAVAMVEGDRRSSASPRGSGADNIRNVTGTPTAGIDPQELLDTRPYAREWHHPHPQRPRALRPAAQVQRRLRRRRHDRRCSRTPTTSASRRSR